MAENAPQTVTIHFSGEEMIIPADTTASEFLGMLEENGILSMEDVGDYQLMGYQAVVLGDNAPVHGFRDLSAVRRLRRQA